MLSRHGFLAMLYDGEHRKFSIDVDFYLRQLDDARVRGPVLELGCGTGRVAVPLAVAGHRVTGLDISPAMLRRARQRRRTLPPSIAIRLRFSQQDMTSFRFRQRFGAALIPFSSLALVVDPGGRQACIERLAEHLIPGGLLLIDLPNPLPLCDRQGPRSLATQFRLPPSGAMVEKTIEETVDAQRRVTLVRYHYTVSSASSSRPPRRVETSFELARVEHTDIAAMLFAAGFDVDQLLGDYRATRYASGSGRLIVRAVRLD